MSNPSFRFMSFFFRFRDFFSPPIKTLEQIGIGPGWNVLDYGCGSGSYSIPAAQLVGPTGKVLRELDRVLKTRGLLSVFDHKFDNDKVVSTVSHATKVLKHREARVGNGKRKGKKTMLIFSKEP